MGQPSKKNKVVTLMTLSIFLFFLIPQVSSLAFKQNEVADIRQAIRVEGGIPPADTLCNISVVYPNNSVMIDFLAMTRNTNGQDYNYTLDTSLTTVIGEYDYAITCLSPEVNKTFSSVFYINPGGIEPTSTKTDTLSRTIYIIFGVSLLLFFGFLFSKQDNVTFKYTYFILSLLFFIIGTNFLFISLQDDMVNPAIQSFFSFFTAASFYLYWFFGFLVGVLWIFAIINTVILKKNEARMRKFDGLGGEF